MEYSFNRTIKLVSAFLIASIVIGFLPWREIRADANTHGEYSAYPLEITYDQNSTWGNSTQGQFEVTNISGYDVTSWTLEIDYYDTVTLSNIWNVSDITDYSTDENIVITSDSTIAAGQTYTFGLIADGIESAPVAPVAVSVVAYVSDEPVITPTPEITEVPTTTEEVIVTEAPIPTEELEPTVFPYAIFAASTTDDFTFQGWKSNITGDIYSGRDFLYQGSELYMEGYARTVGSVQPAGWITDMTGAEEGIEPLPMPDWSEAIAAKEALMPTIPPDALTSQSSIVANGYYYSEDDITINGTDFTGDAVIISQGNITYNVDTLNAEEEITGKILLYSEEGNITINGTKIGICGILYAPQGRVSINAYNTTINGRIVADKFSYSGSILNVISDPSDLQLVTNLPEVTVTASQSEVSIGDTAYYTIEIPKDNVFEILYRLNGTDVEVTIPENEEDPIEYYLDTSEAGTYTLEAYVVLPYGEFALDSDTIGVVSEPTDTPTPTVTEVPTDTPTSTPEPTITDTPTPTVTSIPTVTNEPTITDTPVPTEEPTNTPTSVPTVEPTEIPTDTPTPTAEPTELVINTNTPTPTVTPEPTGTEPDIPFSEKYAIYSQGDPQYNYQEYFDPDLWVHAPDTCGVVTQTYIAAKSQILWSDACVSSTFYREFSPDYSFTMRFTYSNPLCLGNADLIKIKNSTGQSLDIQIDISKSQNHKWKDPYGQGEWQYGTEPYNAMVGINLNSDGMTDYAMAEYLPFLDRNSVHEFWLEYDGQEEMLYVYVATYDENGNVTKPSDPTLMLNISLEDLFEGDHKLYIETDLEMGVHSTRTYIYVFGIEFDPYPEIHKEALDAIEIFGSLSDKYYEVGDEISILGRVSPDIEVDTADLSVLNEDGEEVYQSPIDITSAYDEIARIDTTGWTPGEYTLQITVTDSDSKDYIKEVTITLSPEEIYLELEKAVLDDGVISIYGTVEFSEDGTYELRYFDFEDSLWKTIVVDGEETTGVLGELDLELNPYANIFVDLIAVSDSGVRKSLSGEFLLEITTPTPTVTPTVTPTPYGEFTNEELFADIEDSQDGEEITYITDITGTVSGTELQYYTFEVFPVDSEEAVYTYTGTEAVEEGVVGTIDPTLLINGFYKVRLTAYADEGSLEDEITVLVTGQAKVGNFTVSFLDMTLPVAGLPVEIYRTYDSRQRTVQGDYGYGWTMSVGGPDISISTNLGEDWGTEMQMVFAVPMYYWSEVNPHEVYIDWGNGHEEVFKLVLSPESTLSFDNWVGISASFQNTSGTGDTLEILDGSDNLIYADNSLYTSDLQKFDPQNFLLTRYDGMKFYFNKVSGLYKIVDTYGRTIDITENGIVYSEGGSISFVRDAEGRITSISDGLGNTVTYTYNENGDLVSVVDTAGYTTTFAYDESHYLTVITADNGVTVARNEYDDDGRLVATIDANDNRIEFSHDLDQRIEVTTDRLGYTTIYYYDEAGNVTSITDALGRTTTYTYDSNNNKTSETKPDGTTFSYTYDNNGNLLSATDGNGRTITSTYGSKGELLTMTAMGATELTCVYDNYGNILSATDSSGNTQSYGYDNTGNLTSVTDSLGSLMNLSYDGNGNVTSITNAEGQVTNFSFDSEGRLISRTITYQGVTLTDTYSYDAANRVTGITYSNGNTVSYTYNQAGDVTSSTDSQGRTVYYTYDVYGNLTRIDYPDGTHESFTYDAEGRNLTATDRMGRTVTFTYDAVGNCVSKTYANGTQEIYSYDSCDRLISSTNVYGGTTTYSYDYLGRNTSVTDPQGNTTYYTYNDRGNVASVTDALGNTYSFTYDNNGNQTSVTYPNGSIFSATYDVRGRLTSQSDAYGNTTTYSYDSMDRLISVTDALNGTWTYTYDTMGNVTTVTDANGNITSYEFDTNGQVISVTNAAGNTAYTTYDEYGRVVSTTDFGGNETVYTYDSMDRILTATTGSEVITYTYDTLGNLISVEDSSGTVSYTYNSDGNLSSVTNAEGEVITYSYNSGYQLSGISIDGQTISYGYDNMGRLISVTDSEGTTTYTYDEAGNRVSTCYPNGVTTTYEYNDINVLISEVTTDSSNNILASYEYTIGSNGERLSCTELGRIVEYSYDELGRLISETVTVGDDVSVTTYTYDANSNRLSMTKDGVVTNYSYNELNQITQAGDISYTWDNAGNLVSQSSNGVTIATYTYDCYNRMTSATVNGIDGTITETYTYDYLGNRTSKTTDGVTTYFTVDMSSGYSQVIKAETGPNTIYYTRGFELISRRVGSDAQYYLFDGGMSVRGLTDEDGIVTDTFVYDAFGNETDRTGTTDSPYGFQGEERDSTGLYYLRARYMDPATGTFTSMDTYGGSLSDPMSLHKYLFANANPIKYCDPSGHSSGTLGDAIGTCTIATLLANVFEATIVMASCFISDSMIICTIMIILVMIISAIVVSGLLHWGHLIISMFGDIVINSAFPKTITWDDIKAMIQAKADSITIAREYRSDGEWHHIVARTDYRAYGSRVILRESGFRSYNPLTNFANVDSIENLVYLMTAMHRRLHTDDYHKYVYSVLKSAYNENALEYVNKIDVSIALNMIRSQLLSQEILFPQVLTGKG